MAASSARDQFSRVRYLSSLLRGNQLRLVPHQIGGLSRLQQRLEVTQHGAEAFGRTDRFRRFLESGRHHAHHGSTCTLRFEIHVNGYAVRPAEPQPVRCLKPSDSDGVFGAGHHEVPRHRRSWLERAGRFVQPEFDNRCGVHESVEAALG